MEIVEYLKEVGITPISAIIIGFSIWITLQIYNFKIDKIKREQAQNLEFIKDRLEKRSALLEELNGLAHEFDHSVNHVFDGNRGHYEIQVENTYKKIRTEARSKIELIENDFPDFLAKVYQFTNEGKLILEEKKFNWSRYKNAKEELLALFVSIRASLPGMRIK
ncbi:MAG: hypothetical protein WD426_19425 [Anditalea sp.]